MYILGGIAVALIALLFVIARLPQWLAGDVPTEPITQTTQPTTMTYDTDAGETTRVVMTTNRGDVTIDLFTELMPITAGNFLTLAEEGFYDGVKFHRVIDGFMIQGGDPLTKDDNQIDAWGTGGPGYAIEDEHIEHPALTNIRGTLSMANSGPNSGGSQFFINLVDNTNLDFDKQPLSSQHPVFGRVVEGIDVVEAIGATETDQRDRPLEPVVIERIEIIGMGEQAEELEAEDVNEDDADGEEIRLDIAE